MQFDDPGAASPPSPYDDPTPCPECGVGDAEYGVHEPGCPSGYPTLTDTDTDTDPELTIIESDDREPWTFTDGGLA